MKRVRKRTHARYYKIPAYQILAGEISDERMAAAIGVSKRTYQDKVDGLSDFSAQEMLVVAALLHVGQEELLKQPG